MIRGVRPIKEWLDERAKFAAPQNCRTSSTGRHDSKDSLDSFFSGFAD